MGLEGTSIQCQLERGAQWVSWLESSIIAVSGRVLGDFGVLPMSPGYLGILENIGEYHAWPEILLL